MRASRERWGDLGNAWYAAARSDELGARAPLSRTVLGVRVALWRRRDGTAAAVFDRCLHRNARLGAGVVVDGCLACPYHGWTYAADGRVVGVPSLAPGEAPPALALPSYPVREEGGLVWVWVGDRPPAELPARVPFSMPHWRESGWGAYYMTTRFGNDVTNLVENFMDVPHTVFVHRGWFRSPRRRRVPTRVARTADSVLVTYDQPRDSIGFTNWLMNPRDLPLTHTDKFYLPNTTRVDYVWGDEGDPHGRAFVITSTCTPISERDTMVYTLISYKLGAFNPLAGLWLPAYTRRVIGQDVTIMANQGESLAHHGQPAFHGTEADTIHEHIEALRAWAEAGRPEPGPEPRVDAIEMWV
ncbi:MAG: aromatic ring-hydroxylating dioxygenase subunit alpha [Myxococcota bacterium]